MSSIGFGETTSLLTPDANSFILKNTSDSSVAQFFNGARNQTLTLQPNISLNSLTLTGNVSTTGVFTGNGSGLTALTGATVTGTVNLANYVFQPNQSNIRSLGYLTGLGVQGFMGVGTSTPTSILHLQGVNPRLTLNNVTGSANHLGIDVLTTAGATVPSCQLDFVDDGSSSSHMLFNSKNSSNVLVNRLYIQSNGLVGVNTASPQSLLDINGTCRITGLTTTASINSTGTLTQTGSIVVTGATTNSSISNLSSFPNNGSGSTRDALVIAQLNGSTARFNLWGDVYNVGPQIDACAQVFRWMPAGANPTTEFMRLSGAVLTLNGNLVVLDPVNNDGAAHIIGCSALTNGTNTGLAIGKQGSLSNAGVIMYYHTADGSALNTMNFGIYGINNQIMSVAANSCIGINNSAPLVPLHIGCSYPAGGTITPVFRIQQNAYAHNIGMGGYFTGSDGNTLTLEGGGIYGSVSLATNGASRLLVNNVGNVGIGNAAPTARLHVSGSTILQPNLSSTYGCIVQADLPLAKDVAAGYDPSNNDSAQLRILTLNNVGTFGQAGLNIGVSSNTTTNSAGSAFLQTINIYTGFLPLLLNPRGGNVGIGVMSPVSPLHVYSNAGARITLQNGAGGVHQGIDFQAYNTSGNTLQLDAVDDGSYSSNFFINTKTPGSATNSMVTRMSVMSGGNVGMNGCTNPGCSLSFGQAYANKVLSLFDSGSTDAVASATNFFGFGINAATLRYQVPGAQQHAWFIGGTNAMTIDASSSVIHNAATYLQGPTYCGGVVNILKGSGQGVEAYYAGNDRYGITQDNNGQMRMYTSSSYSAASIKFCSAISTTTFIDFMTILTSGFVGIGRSDPPFKFSLSGPNSSVYGPHIATYGRTDAYPIFTVLSWDHDNICMMFDAQYNGNFVSSSTTNQYSIYKQNGLLNFNYASVNTAGSTLSWGTGFTMNNLGYVGFGGNTAPAYPIDVNGSGRFNQALYTTNVIPNLDNIYTIGVIAKRYSTIYAANGTIQTSDSRTKTAVPLNYGLADLMKVNTINYQWKSQKDLPDDNPEKNFRYYGFCADELVKIFPELVYSETYDADGHAVVSENDTQPVQMNYSELLPVAVNAIKELSSQVVALQTQLASVMALLTKNNIS